MTKKKGRFAYLLEDEKVKIKSKDIEEIVRLVRDGVPTKIIASQYGVTARHICRVVKQRSEKQAG